MRSLMISRRGLDNSPNSRAVVGPNGRVQTAMVVALLCLAGIGFAASSSLLAEDPEMPPTSAPVIEGFQVTWEETDPGNNIFTYTFTGTIQFGEGLVNPIIELSGYPFDDLVVTSPSGAFQHVVSLSEEVAVGRMIVAVVLEGGVEVSAPATTST